MQSKRQEIQTLCSDISIQIDNLVSNGQNIALLQIKIYNIQ